MNPADAWRGDAACRDAGVDVVLAFHDYALETGEPGPDMRAVEVRYCRGCPVRAECLEDAWVRSETGGMRAGATPAQLRWLLRNPDHRRPRCSKCARVQLDLLDVVAHWDGQRSRCPACRDPESLQLEV